MYNNTKNEELEVLKAIGVIARYRSRFSNGQRGFENISQLVELLLDVAYKTCFCTNCGMKIDFYAIYDR